ncbi:uncharacterized protein SCHCODRAFT_02603136 [Schizophyllum commune H4-8]|uniref:uncharacterized protein n=1 Tax=Schizophyllum commune (strain H4-8 / FGSC 9210) TaxID=578458 RepID=UPI00215F4D32|nr:uncharacterized protein SCHCODRAFT_02603136 [Schizophyllum commune H4-8]KAI5886708.1 hypothetical protein SCHCODRAFT_02603136 [Schizophyllum commune H4-8]
MSKCDFNISRRGFREQQPDRAQATVAEAFRAYYMGPSGRLDVRYLFGLDLLTDADLLVVAILRADPILLAVPIPLAVLSMVAVPSVLADASLPVDPSVLVVVTMLAVPAPLLLNTILLASLSSIGEFVNAGTPFVFRIPGRTDFLRRPSRSLRVPSRSLHRPSRLDVRRLFDLALLAGATMPAIPIPLAVLSMLAVPSELADAILPVDPTMLAAPPPLLLNTILLASLSGIWELANTGAPFVFRTPKRTAALHRPSRSLHRPRRLDVQCFFGLALLVDAILRAVPIWLAVPIPLAIPSMLVVPAVLVVPAMLAVPVPLLVNTILLASLSSIRDFANTAAPCVFPIPNRTEFLRRPSRYLRVPSRFLRVPSRSLHRPSRLDVRYFVGLALLAHATMPAIPIPLAVLRMLVVPAMLAVPAPLLVNTILIASLSGIRELANTGTPCVFRISRRADPLHRPSRSLHHLTRLDVR